MTSRIFTLTVVLGCLGLATTPALAADMPSREEIAKIGAKLVGLNYLTYTNCKAPADQLSDYLAKSKVRFAAAGSDFDPQFEAGKADGAKQWDSLSAQLGGEDKMREATCVNALKNLQSNLARK